MCYNFFVMPVHQDYEARKVSRAKPPKPEKRPRTPEERKRVLVSIGHGILVVFAAFGVVLFIFLGSGILKQWIESVIEGRFIAELQQKVQHITQAPPAEQKPSSQQPAAQPQAPTAPPQQTPPAQRPFFRIIPESQVNGVENLVASSFSDLFSGVAWLNQNKTTLYHDWAATALTFEPNVVWEKATFPNADRFRVRREDGSDVLCLPAGCLKQMGNTLSLNGVALALPSEMDGKTIENVSIGELTSRWVVGVVTSGGGKYEGWVYTYDGSSFQKVFGQANTPFQSTYKGVMGFGGTDDDWIAVYGGYEGIAYHIRAGSPFTDVSKFFSIRMMDNGFQPVVTRVDAFGKTMWYVWSLSDRQPELAKLYEDSSGAIVGAVNFTRRLFANTGASRASFRYAGTQGNSVLLQALLAYGGGNTETYVFSDSGFAAPSTAVVESVNISNYPAEVRSATITEAQVFTGAGSVKYYLSNDGNSWVAAEPGKEVVFPKSDGHLLFWRAEFTPSFDAAQTPPFLDKIRIDYKVKFT